MKTRLYYDQIIVDKNEMKELNIKRKKPQVRGSKII